MKIKDMIGVTVGAIVGGEAIRQVGNIGAGMSSGMKSATQSLIGVGIVGNTAKLIKKW